MVIFNLYLGLTFAHGSSKPFHFVRWSAIQRVTSFQKRVRSKRVRLEPTKPLGVLDTFRDWTGPPFDFQGFPLFGHLTDQRLGTRNGGRMRSLGPPATESVWNVVSFQNAWLRACNGRAFGTF